jgi:hypothetical protein
MSDTRKLASVPTPRGWERAEYFTFDGDRSIAEMKAQAERQGDPLFPDDSQDEAKVDALFGIPTALQDMWDAGLIYLVNVCVLHHYGYAVGVDVGTDGKAIGLALFRTNDPEGVVFSEEMQTMARQKVLRMMHEFAQRQSDARDAEADARE